MRRMLFTVSVFALVTAALPAAAQPVSPLRFAQPRAILSPGGTPGDYGWNTPGGLVTLRLVERNLRNGMVQYRLHGAWPGGGDILGTATLNPAGTCSVVVNERHDGALVVRFEEAGHSSDPGTARVVLLAWNPAVNAPRSLGVWDGSSTDTPPAWARVVQQGGGACSRIAACCHAYVAAMGSSVPASTCDAYNNVAGMTDPLCDQTLAGYRSGFQAMGRAVPPACL